MNIPNKLQIDEIRSLIPKSKSDVETAQAAVAAGYPKIDPILPELMEWIQDCNWPVAQVLRPFLPKIGLPLLPHIRVVLSSDDAMWKYWVLGIIGESRDLYSALTDDLSRLANHPTDSEKMEEVDVRAKEMIERSEKNSAF